MVELCLSGRDVEFTSLTSLASGFRRHYPTVTVARRAPNAKPTKTNGRWVRLNITRQCMSAPYKVCPLRGVTLSMWQSEGISRYAGISQNAYLVLCGLLGISQWSVLNANPLFRPYDLIHPPDSNCLFVQPGGIENFALLLEDPQICAGCVDFYHCLGADGEVIALLDTLAGLRRARQDRNRVLRSI